MYRRVERAATRVSSLAGRAHWWQAVAVAGGAGLWLRDDQEIIRLYVGMNKTDVTEIKLNDPNGKELISLSADEVGSMLSLKMSADTYRRVKASVNGGQGALFEVLNKNGQVGWRSPNVPNK